MAIQTYVLDAGSTFKGVAITDATDFTFSESGSPTNLSTDGSRSVGLTVIDNKVGQITVNGVNGHLVANAAFRAGASGALILHAKLRGAGDSTSTTMVFTFGEAVFVNSSVNAPNEAAGSISMSFTAYDSNDDGSIFSVA